MKKSFTLIELLVVIAIIAILAAILMPALQQARERAMTTNCMSNLRQMSTAGSMYMDDHRGFWPCGIRYYFSYITQLARANLVPQAAAENGNTFANCPKTEIQSQEINATLWQQTYGTHYVHNDAESNWFGTGFPVMDSPDQNLAYYQRDVLVPNAGPVPLSRRVMLADSAMIRDDKVLVQSAHLYTVGLDIDASSKVGTPYFVHGERINVVCFGGNAESLSYDDHWNNYFYPYFGYGGKPVAMLPKSWITSAGQFLFVNSRP